MILWKARWVISWWWQQNHSTWRLTLCSHGKLLLGRREHYRSCQAQVKGEHRYSCWRGVRIFPVGDSSEDFQARQGNLNLCNIFSCFIWVLNHFIYLAFILKLIVLYLLCLITMGHRCSLSLYLGNYFCNFPFFQIKPPFPLWEVGAWKNWKTTTLAGFSFCSVGIRTHHQERKKDFWISNNNHRSQQLQVVVSNIFWSKFLLEHSGLTSVNFPLRLHLALWSLPQFIYECLVHWLLFEVVAQSFEMLQTSPPCRDLAWAPFSI